MKKQFACLLIFFSGFIPSLSAQKKEKELLCGTWESNGITINDVYFPETDGTTQLSFYPYHIFQDLLFGCYTDSAKVKCDTSYIRTGHWKLTQKKQLIYSDYYSTTIWGPIFNDGDTTIVVLLNDTALTLSSTGNHPDLYYYKRIPAKAQIPTKPKAVENIPVVVNTPDTFNRYKIFLVNSIDTSKKIRINNSGSTAELKTSAYTPDSTRRMSTWYAGDINTLNDSTLGMTYRQENIHTYLVQDDMYAGETSMTYSGFQEPFREIKLNTISSIRYSSAKRASAFNTGGVFTFFASFSTLIVAPLVSINYKHGGFNSKRYFLWTGIGLGVISVTVPLMIFTHPKTYLLTQKNKTANKKYWYFEKQYY